MCNTVNCLRECSDNKPTVHRITDKLWVGEHNKENATHYCIFDDEQDKSVLSLVSYNEECLCMDKILTDPRAEDNLSGPFAFVGYLREICKEMDLARGIDVKSVLRGMPCEHCVQIEITNGGH